MAVTYTDKTIARLREAGTQLLVAQRGRPVFGVEALRAVSAYVAATDSMRLDIPGSSSVAVVSVPSPACPQIVIDHRDRFRGTSENINLIDATDLRFVAWLHTQLDAWKRGDVPSLEAIAVASLEWSE